jgi:hypothetical protein
MVPVLKSSDHTINCACRNCGAVLLLHAEDAQAIATTPAKTPRGARCSDVSLIPGHARTLPLPRSRSEHTRTGGLQLGAMPLPISSSIAFLFLGRCDSPMPRSTFGALVNWTFS